MSALGDKFRLAREARGLSLSTVAEKIHIRSVYLDALERGEWSLIGAPVYVRGFIRTYARYLNLEPEAAVAEFRDELGGAAPEAAVATTAAEPAGRPSALVLVLGIVALALVIYAGYTIYEWKSGTQGPVAGPAPTQASAAPAATPAALAPAAIEPSPTPAPKVANTLEIRLSQRSWVRVAIDGATPMEGIFPEGTDRKFHGKAATVRVGNAGGVAVFVNGKDIGKLGADGEVAERALTLAAHQ